MPKTDVNPNAKNRIHKAIETWFAKIYLNKIIHNAKDTIIFVNKSSCLAFILSIYGKTEENKSKMTPAVMAYIKKTKNTFIAKLKRVKTMRALSIYKPNTQSLI
ncbi:hypothetical protein LZC34_09080 [Campylobacter jejuni]|nr:hypothetical protein [Campylobacter jejuni]MCH3877305.1 hypothetical protein [Campylobacter jejuni]